MRGARLDWSGTSKWTGRLPMSRPFNPIASLLRTLAPRKVMMAERNRVSSAITCGATIPISAIVNALVGKDRAGQKGTGNWQYRRNFLTPPSLIRRCTDLLIGTGGPTRFSLWVKIQCSLYGLLPRSLSSSLSLILRSDAALILRLERLP